MSATGRTTRPVTAAELPGELSRLLDDGYRLTLVAAHEDPDAFRVVYLLTAAGPDRRVELELRTDLAEPRLPSMAGLSFPLGRFEREMRDLYGIVPLDHPLPRRLVRHAHWPTGWYPARSDAGPPPPFAPEAAYPFVRVEGRGVYEIPVGPIHAGMIEPGHFRFSVVGETILKLKARLWFTHKGLEKLAEGCTPEEAFALAERVSGDTTAGHAAAFALAVEEALGWQVPEPAQAARAALLELERLYNHVADIGALCNDVGYGVLNTHAQRVREGLLRLNEEVTGHRLLRGGVVLGGARLAAVPDAARVARIGDEIAEIVDLALRNSVVVDRFTGTATLAAENAREIGVLGYVARASSVDVDARRDHPFCEATTAVRSAVRTEGDVLARFLVRAEEVRASVELLPTLLAGLSAGDLVAPPPRVGPARAAGARAGVGLVEGWRGTIAHRVELGADGRLTRLKVVDPSFFTWPALPVALRQTIVADFPVTNKSFNLSYAGNDL
ncbi:hydrogenase large subunit [Actinotalea fermentans]|uniref:Formate hydrogenase HycE n=1 Tax=Actinotalea fermentans TaxID=43671 RepID=A0A511Z1V7_9CELL|nr:NADH-quinone oxidoreductase subunit C [Actinotalea fermentans]KGM16271.1 formate hydrogenase [Actinotalea fermentans ATCC 43279 = JCM 9966 = DSM 3133]GEN81435.1 formate hydrogenase HycE [Actinotalea fermentans]